MSSAGEWYKAWSLESSLRAHARRTNSIGGSTCHFAGILAPRLGSHRRHLECFIQLCIAVAIETLSPIYLLDPFDY